VKRLALMMVFAALMIHTSAVAAEVPAAKEVSTSPEGCRVEKFTIPSPSMSREIKVVIVLPPEYDANPAKTYPVLYGLHGRGAPYTVWSDMSPLRRAMKTQPMILASFDCDQAGWYIDASKKPESQFRTFFFDEFMPYVETAYRASGVRGITGFSMGGYGALYYMVEKPDLFASISALSSAVGLIRGDGVGQRDLQSLLGPYEENKAKYDKLVIADRIAARIANGGTLPPILMHCGTEDHLLNNNREFLAFLVAQNKLIRERLEPQVADETDARQKRNKLGALMAKHQIDFTHVESPGAHDWSFWVGASAAVADFHWKHFQNAKPKPLK
jgi:S-formylglutathione hydrolase FrmB